MLQFKHGTAAVCGLDIHAFRYMSPRAKADRTLLFCSKNKHMMSLPTSTVSACNMHAHKIQCSGTPVPVLTSGDCKWASLCLGSSLALASAIATAKGAHSISLTSVDC